MDDNKTKEVACGRCGVFFYEFEAKEVEVYEGIDSDGEEIVDTIYLCPHCAEP